jgi:hypothetical protein
MKCQPHVAHILYCGIIRGLDYTFSLRRPKLGRGMFGFRVNNPNPEAFFYAILELGLPIEWLL